MGLSRREKSGRGEVVGVVLCPEERLLAFLAGDKFGLSAQVPSPLTPYTDPPAPRLARGGQESGAEIWPRALPPPKSPAHVTMAVD